MPEKRKKFMFKIYVYVLDTLADWEIGYITSELSSGRFFRKDAPGVSLKTVSISEEPVRTMGGLTIVPDCLTEDIVINEKSVLILPGANTWSDPKHSTIIKKTCELISAGGTVCAICGATVALANTGLLDNRPHTSNGAGFLDMFSPCYKGQEFYEDKPSVADNNLITAACTGSLLWTKQILQRLDVLSSDTLEAWYNYFNTGKSEYFYAIMQSLPSEEQN